jgi:hypothetical protein
VADGEVGLFTAQAEALVSSGPGASTFLGRSFQQKDSGASPPLGTRSRVKCSLQERLKKYLEVLCMKIHRLTTNGKGEYLR